MAVEQRAPIWSSYVKVTYDVFLPTRAEGHLSVYDDHMSIRICNLKNKTQDYTLQNFTIKTVPDVENMITIGTKKTEKLDVFVFFLCQRARDNCLIACLVLDRHLLDKLDNNVAKTRLKSSSSMPCLAPVVEK